MAKKTKQNKKERKSKRKKEETFIKIGNYSNNYYYGDQNNKNLMAQNTLLKNQLKEAEKKKFNLKMIL